MALHWVTTAIGIDAKTQDDAFRKLDRVLDSEFSKGENETLPIQLDDFMYYILTIREDARFPDLDTFRRHLHKQ